MKESDLRYEAILDWNMTVAEAEAYKIAVQYEKEFIRQFRGTAQMAGYKRNSLPNTGDPRKSLLFRYCWKLRRETRGLLESDQYRQYIHANLVVLKLNNARVEPNAICGDKAWIRWKVWERWYQAKLDEKNVEKSNQSFAAEPKIIKEIDRTKKFLFERCEGEPTVEKVKKFIDDGIFRIWVMTGKVSSYYLALSPFVSKNCDVSVLASTCCIDPTLLKQIATEAVVQYFQKEFAHEFGS